MKVMICSEHGVLEYDEREKPKISKGQAIIKIERIGIRVNALHALFLSVPAKAFVNGNGLGPDALVLVDPFILS